MTLESLHAAYQGVHGMQLQADQAVWWSGLAPAIKQVQAQCWVCHEVAPVLSQMTPTRPSIPNYPFHMVSADHFTLAGQNYLVIMDRFSGWPVVEHCGDTVGAATGLLRTLRTYFGTFGVPEELATDGKTVFTSVSVKEFLLRHSS